ncbi:hypothetical protein E3U23_04080 [Erythrobacter litoralis]|uniref:hypothetical protein n=1 Tax=Erythrobacter litoralis TaxID=39960 RepID=UPI002435FC50|nr:hypothetical protein [Erythrobacter litoralis]MDG6078369.1 hypothetical protein [Erythrobacter litoralis]
MFALVAIAFGIAIGIGLISLLIAMIFSSVIGHFRPDMPTTRVSHIASGFIPVSLSLLGLASLVIVGDPVSGPAAQGMLVAFVICCGLLFIVWPINNKLVSVFLRNRDT